jgi:hypothetical protein
MKILSMVLVILMLVGGVSCRGRESPGGDAAAPNGTLAPSPAPIPPAACNGGIATAPPHLMSVGFYSSFAGRSVPAAALKKSVEAALIPTTYQITEDDVIRNQKYARQGVIVLLGTEGDNVYVGFTSRYMVDIDYPARQEDWIGAPDWKGGRLVLNGKNGVTETYRLRAHKGAGLPTFVERDIAYYRLVSDNDIALVYFPPAAFGRQAVGDLAERRLPADPLGLAHPTEEVEILVQESTHLFGQDFLLVSEASWRELGNLRHPQKLAYMLTGAGIQILAKAVLQSLDVSSAAQGVSIFGFTQLFDVVGDRPVVPSTAGRPRYLALALAPPRSVALHVAWLEPGRAEVAVEGKVEAASLVLVDLASLGSEQVKAIQDFVSGPLLKMGAGLMAVRFGDGTEVRAPLMIFDKATTSCLNYELVAHGLARLKLDDGAAACAFPEFVTAAQDALKFGYGFACNWRGERYAEDLARVSASCDQARAAP